MVSVADLVDVDSAGWARATWHPFGAAGCDGSLPEAAFNAWLVQDSRFVGDLLRFRARLLARVPRAAQPVVAGGAVALVDELAWFVQHADKRGLALTTLPLPATVRYAELLDSLDRADVPVALAMLWSIERVYLDAWSHAAAGAPAYRDFVDHWTTPEFGRYVSALAAADEALDCAGGSDVHRCFGEVVDAESRFWDMAWTGERR